MKMIHRNTVTAFLIFLLQVIEFLHIILPPNTAMLEDISLWLSLAEALVLPHILWIFSRRYRHALVYTWRFHVLRDSAIEEEGGY